MGLRTWSKENLEYGRKVLSSGLEGAHAGREAFLNGRSFTPVLTESISRAWTPAVVGACIGVLAGKAAGRNGSNRRVAGFGFLGAVVGLCAGIVWENRQLTESVARSAMRNVAKVRDERWLETHPIDYA